MRIGEEYEKMYLDDHEEETTQIRDEMISKKVNEKINKNNKELWQSKAQHGYIFKKTIEKESTDVKNSNL